MRYDKTYFIWIIFLSADWNIFSISRHDELTPVTSVICVCWEFTAVITFLYHQWELLWFIVGHTLLIPAHHHEPMKIFYISTIDWSTDAVAANNWKKFLLLIYSFRMKHDFLDARQRSQNVFILLSWSFLK